MIWILLREAAELSMLFIKQPVCRDNIRQTKCIVFGWTSAGCWIVAKFKKKIPKLCSDKRKMFLPVFATVGFQVACTGQVAFDPEIKHFYWNKGKAGSKIMTAIVTVSLWREVQHWHAKRIHLYTYMYGIWDGFINELDLLLILHTGTRAQGWSSSNCSATSLSVQAQWAICAMTL